MRKLGCLAVLLGAALLAHGGGAGAEEGATGWTVYPPMSPEAPDAERQISVRPGTAPGIETLLLDEKVMLIASPPAGFCPMEAEPVSAHDLRTQYGLKSRVEEPALGLFVDCASQDERHPIYLSVQPAYSAGAPVSLGFTRPDFLDMTAHALAVTPHLDTDLYGEAQAMPAIERWLSEAEQRSPASCQGTAPAGTFWPDDNAHYSIILRCDGSGERPAVSGVLDSSTIINGLYVSVHAVSEIEHAEDVRRLLDAAKLYVHHLIEVNEGEPQPR